MASITVKIFYHNQTSKTFKFPVDYTIADALKEIRQKIGMEGNLDHELFEHASKGKKARWLHPTRTFKFYGISSGAELEFKKKHRIMKVNFPDESQRSILIDSSLVIKEIIKAIAHKVLIRDFEEYGLRRPNTPETAWLDVEKTLYEEDVPEDEVLIFGKILHANDFMIDSDDVMQVHLVFTQSANDVVAGKFDPLQRTEVAELAATQIQTIYGNFDQEKYKNNLIDFTRLVPPSWRKDRKLEKLIAGEHEKLIGMKENQAKLRYVQIVRSLPTYGISQFEVIERHKGKKKGNRLILGITKDKILLLDCETRNFIKEWEVEKLRKWAPTSNTLTLDFGDYEDDYFVFQTDEADAISRMIGAYIDIKIKNQKDIAQQVMASEDTSAMEATINSVSHVIGNVAQPVSRSFITGYNTTITNTSHSVAMPRNTPVSVAPTAISSVGTILPRSHSVRVTDMRSTLDAFKILQEEINTDVHSIKLPSITPVQWYSQMTKCRDELNESLSKLTNQDVLKNYDKSSIDKISVDIHRSLVALAATSKGFSSVRTGTPVMSSTQSISKLSTFLLETINRGYEKNILDSEELKECIKQVASSVDKIMKSFDLMDKSENFVDIGSLSIINNCSDSMESAIRSLLDTISEHVERTPDAGVNTLLQGSALQLQVLLEADINSLNSLSPAVQNSEIMRRVLDISDDIVNSLSRVTSKIVSAVTDGNLKEFVGNSLILVQESAQRLKLVEKIKGGRLVEGKLNLAGNSSIIFLSLDQICKNIDDVNSLINNSKSAIKASNLFLSGIRAISGLCVGNEELLLSTAHEMSNNIQQLMENARVLSRNPNDQNSKNNVIRICTGISDNVKILSGIALSKANYLDLRNDLMLSYSEILSLNTVLQNSLFSINDQSVRQNLASTLSEVKKVDVKVFDVLNATKSASDDLKAVNQIIDACGDIIPAYRNMISVAMKSQKFVEPAVLRQRVGLCCDKASQQIDGLERMIRNANSVDDTFQIDNLLTDYTAIIQEAQSLEYLQPVNLDGAHKAEYYQNAVELLNVSKSQLNEALLRLYEASKTGENVPSSTSDVINSASLLFSAAKSLITSVDDSNTRKLVISSTKKLLEGISQLMDFARVSSSSIGDPKHVTALNELFKSVNSSMDTLTVSSRGINLTEFDKLSENIIANSRSVNCETPSDVNYNICTKNLISLSKAFSIAASQLISSVTSSPQNFLFSARNVSTLYTQMCSLITKVSSNSPDSVIASQLIKNNSSLASSLTELLTLSKSAVSEQKDYSTQLEKMGESITTSIRNITHLIGSSIESYKESESLIINSMERLNSPGEDKALLHILEEYTINSQAFIASIQTITTAVHLSTSKLDTYCWESAQLFQSLVDTSRSILTLYSKESVPGPLLLKEYMDLFEAMYQSLVVKADFTNSVSMTKKLAHANNQILAISRGVSSVLEESEASLKRNIIRHAKKMAIDTQNLIKSANKGTSLQESGGEYAGERDNFNKILDGIRNSVVELGKLLKEKAQLYVHSEKLEPGLYERICDANRVLGSHLLGIIKAAMTAESNKTPGNLKEFSSFATEIATSLNNLNHTFMVLNPGVKEFELLKDSINSFSAQVDSCSIQVLAGIQLARPSTGKNFNDCQNELTAKTKLLAESLSGANAMFSEFHPHSLSREVQALSKSFNAFAAVAIDCIYLAPNLEHQKELVMRFKDIVNSLVQYTHIATTKILSNEAKLEEISPQYSVTANTLSTLLKSIQSDVVTLDDLEETIEMVKSLRSTIDEPLTLTADVKKQYSEYCQIIDFSLTRELTNQVVMISMQTPDTGQNVLSFLQIKESLPKWINAIRGCITTTLGNDMIKKEMSQCAKSLLSSIENMLVKSKNSILNPSDTSKNVIAQDVFDNITRLVSAAKRGDVGEIEYSKSIDFINDSLSKLTNFGVYGQPQMQNMEFASQATREYQKQLESDLNSVGELMRSLRQSVAINCNNLGTDSSALAKKFSEISSTIVSMVPMISDSAVQQELLSESKMFGMRLYQLLLAAKTAGTNRNDGIAQKFYENAEEVMNNLLKSFSNVINKGTLQSSAGERLLNENINRIANLRVSRVSKVDSNAVTVAHDVHDLVSLISNFVISQNQGELVENSNNTTDMVERILFSVNNVVESAPDEESKNKMIQLSESLVDSVENLFKLIKNRYTNEVGPDEIQDAASHTTGILTDIVDGLKSFPGGNEIYDVNIDNLEKLAIKELENCANIIEEACSNLNITRTKKIDVSGSLNKDMALSDSILLSVQAITSTTKILVDAATAIQNERVKSGYSVPTKEKYHRDPTWSNGLISAAKNVSVSVQQLVKVSIDAVSSDNENQEAIIAATKAVSTSTAHLVTASRVRADMTSPNQQNLNKVAVAVTNAAAKLVKAVHEAAESKEQTEQIVIESGFTGSTKAKFDQQIKILKLEAEIEKERRRLASMNKRSYMAVTQS